ncbi:unnamed protein product [Adineta steineri]|uniref:NAD(P)(+)--arginine ADP-ribosyltransferase n=1 Tax=Adineta steineri TaxID=433720 RepID=A0A818WMI6_9BILA|nr:unnamed protein product [Adineta steineri]CAF3728143.1 unnamed protein product [Adineta steineri]
MANNKSTTSVQTNTQANAKHVSNFSKDAVENRCINMQRVQNFLLIWLDNNINNNNADCNNTIKQLKRVVNNVNTFTDCNQCIEFIQTITKNKICMVVSGSLGKYIMPHIHDMYQVDTIFIFSRHRRWRKRWAKQWSKIKGFFTDITSVCEALKQVAHQCEQNSTSVSFVASSKNLDDLDPAFMYTQILKEILLTINCEDKNLKEFITYCRNVYDGDENQLKNVHELQTTYKYNIPIWWYTWDPFLYRMLNCALRSMNFDIIVRMGFFIYDLHRDIQRLHSEQFDGDQSGQIFTVYRGQGLSNDDFTKMTNTKGGFLSFNNFLSTSKNHDVSLNLAQQAATNPDLVGILFVMSINPTDSTIPFASITDVSYFHMEDEVLFSIHTIFRIEDIKSMDGNKHLYQVKLTLTSDNEQDLRTLAHRVRQETFPSSIGWHRLGLLLEKMGQFSKAQEIYEVLLHQTTYESDKAPIYIRLGQIKYNQGEYQEALTYYKKTLLSNHSDLDVSYNNIGLVYYNISDYPKALLFHEKALIIREQSLPSNHPDLASSYIDTANVHCSMADYPKALSYYEKALEIRQQSLPPNHPDLASSYMDIGIVYYSMGDYPKALLFHKKALTIREQSLPSNHPDLASSYMDTANVYCSMADYPKALSYYEKALEIQQQSLPLNHPNLSASYNNIGSVYYNMDDYLTAFSYYEKALKIRQQSLSLNHPDLGASYNNIGLVYYNMGDYSKVFSYYEKALKIRQQSLPLNHPDLASSYNNIGSVYYNMGNYRKALSYYEKALEIQEQSLPSNHPDLASSYNNIGSVYHNMGDYPKAVSCYEEALSIRQQLLSPNHPDLSMCYDNIGLVYYSIGDYPRALLFYKKTLLIRQQPLSSNHRDLGASYNNIGAVHENMGNYADAHAVYERAVRNALQSLPSNHPSRQQWRKNLERIKKKL